MVHRYYCVYTYIYKYILDNTTLNSGHTVSFVTFTSYGFSVIEGTVRQRRVHQLCIGYRSITYTYHRAHWHDHDYISGNTMEQKYGYPEHMQARQPNSTNGFFHTYSPIRWEKDLLAACTPERVVISTYMTLISQWPCTTHGTGWDDHEAGRMNV